VGDAIGSRYIAASLCRSRSGRVQRTRQPRARRKPKPLVSKADRSLSCSESNGLAVADPRIIQTLLGHSTPRGGSERSI
jgi:hypothetical protein